MTKMLALQPSQNIKIRSTSRRSSSISHALRSGTFVSAGRAFNRRLRLVPIIHSQESSSSSSYTKKHPFRTSHSHGKRAAYTKEAPMRGQAASREPPKRSRRGLEGSPLRPRHRRSRAHHHANEGRALATTKAACAARCYSSASRLSLIQQRNRYTACASHVEKSLSKQRVLLVRAFPRVSSFPAANLGAALPTARNISEASHKLPLAGHKLPPLFLPLHGGTEH